MARSCSAIAGASWPDASATCRPSTSVAPMPVGGRTHGALHLRPSTTGVPGFDSTKHGWYSPQGMAEEFRLAEPAETGSWAWSMRKAQDHIGYGESGHVDINNVQITAVSGDTPEWYLGTRTLAGPLGTRKLPVRRCPHVEIDGKQVRVRAKTFTQGDSLNTIEQLHERHSPPTPVLKSKPVSYFYKENPCTRSNLKAGGCQVQPIFRPKGMFKTYEG